MEIDSITMTVIDALLAEEIPFLLAGSFSSNFYGIPRSTQDADFVIELGDKPLLVLRDHLPAHYHLDPQLEFELVTGTYRNVIRVDGTQFKVELFHVSNDAHDRERFHRREGHTIAGRTVYLPTAEDVVIMKLRWGIGGARSKDVEDVRNVIAVQRGQLDWDYIHRWCNEHGTRELLEQIRSEIPPAE